jgi:hypothetical protein
MDGKTEPGPLRQTTHLAGMRVAFFYSDSK